MSFIWPCFLPLATGLLREGDSRRGGVDAALAGAARDAEEAILTPLFAPRVLHSPILRTVVIFAEADEQHRVVERVGVAVRRVEDTRLVPGRRIPRWAAASARVSIHSHHSSCPLHRPPLLHRGDNAWCEHATTPRTLTPPPPHRESEAAFMSTETGPLATSAAASTVSLVGSAAQSPTAATAPDASPHQPSASLWPCVVLASQ